MTRWIALAVATGVAGCASITGGGGGGGGGDDDPQSCIPMGTGSGSAEGDLVFVLPYKAAPIPAEQTIETPAKIARADIAILLDTTGSMTGTTTQIQGQLAAIV